MSAVKEQVNRIIVERLGLNPDQFDESASFVADLGADGLDAELMADAFQEAFGVSHNELQPIILRGTVGEVIRYIEVRRLPEPR